jgi:hypothetical protein
MKSSDHQTIPASKPRNMRIEQLAFDLVDTHSHFHRRASRFDFQCRDDVLIVRGQVPTFHLKQLLQSVLRELDGVCTLDYQVQVASSHGLSEFAYDGVRPVA